MLLTIVIPSYNHERFVLSTIRAASNIDVKDKEIIVIDDGSSDTSVSVIREYIANNGKHSNIKFIARENRGLVTSLNEGLSIALGKYFYLVGSDDIPIPEGVRALVTHLEQHQDLRFVLGNALFMNSEYQREFECIYGDVHRRFFALSYERRQKEMTLNYLPILLQATVFKTSTLKDIGGWREDIVSDDLSMFLRLFSQPTHVGTDFAYQPDVMTCFYRRHETNSYKNVERHFMAVGQVITHLCPAEYRDAAYLRLFVHLGIISVKAGNLSQAARFFHSTVARVGLLRALLFVGPALITSMMARLSQRLSPTIIVAHEAAATMLDHSRKDHESHVLSN